MKQVKMELLLEAKELSLEGQSACFTRIKTLVQIFYNRIRSWMLTEALVIQRLGGRKGVEIGGLLELAGWAKQTNKQKQNKTTELQVQGKTLSQGIGPGIERDA